MFLPGARGQAGYHYSYRADGKIAAGGTSQLLLPAAVSRSMLSIQNTSNGALYLEFGSARASCSLSSATVSSISVVNGGFGFTAPPHVHFYGGGLPSGYIVGYAGQPDYAAPCAATGGHPAHAHAVLTSGVVTSIVIDDPGAAYQYAPFVFLANTVNDPFGCADPFYGSANSGAYLAAGGGNFYVNGSACPTDQIAIWGATTGQTFFVQWMS